MLLNDCLKLKYYLCENYKSLTQLTKKRHFHLRHIVLSWIFYTLKHITCMTLKTMITTKCPFYKLNMNNCLFKMVLTRKKKYNIYLVESIKITVKMEMLMSCIASVYCYIVIVYCYIVCRQWCVRGVLLSVMERGRTLHVYILIYNKCL